MIPLCVNAVLLKKIHTVIAAVARTDMNVLISLHKGYGMGDAVAMSAVLRHIAKHRPNWVVDFQAETGRHVIGRGIVNNTFAYGEPYPSSHYDAEVQIRLYDTYAAWTDRPNTRVTSCLHEQFGLEWDAECCRYQIHVSGEAMAAAGAVLHTKSSSDRLVAVHYQGDTAKHLKDLTHSQATDICKAIGHLGYTPLVIDWRCQSPLLYRRLTYPSDWGCNAEMNCAVIAQCKAFIGIDSGPGKCASATNTPSLIVWTKHHPAVFHDPASNTTHLVPRHYHKLHPVCGNLDVARWFERHYTTWCYDEDSITCEVEAWLREVLQ